MSVDFWDTSENFRNLFLIPSKNVSSDCAFVFVCACVCMMACVCIKFKSVTPMTSFKMKHSNNTIQRDVNSILTNWRMMVRK